MRQILLLTAGALFGAGGISCIVEVREPVHAAYMSSDDGDYYVSEAPPPPQTEVIAGPAPGPQYVWVGGYWGYYQNRYHWVHGGWAPRPRPGAIWVHPSWVAGPRGHHYVRGYWR